MKFTASIRNMQRGKTDRELHTPAIKSMCWVLHLHESKSLYKALNIFGMSCLRENRGLCEGERENNFFAA